MATTRIELDLFGKLQVHVHVQSHANFSLSLYVQWGPKLEAYIITSEMSIVG